VDPAGEEHAHAVQRRAAEQDRDLLLPQREAGSRAGVAAAFPAFEHELPSALREEAREQGRRRDVQECLDPGVFEGLGLRWSAAGDDGIGRLGRQHLGQLRRTDLRLGETEDAHAPRPVRQAAGRLGEQCPGLFAGHQRQREEGQAAALGHGLGERGLIAHPGHRALSNRVPDIAE
jgi:hypothetical protein